jgi:hypothetical protein
MDPAVNDALGIFFKLKGKYEKEVNKAKEKIMKRSDITLAEKRDLYQEKKFKCIICKQEGGSIFKIEPTRYIAMCGAESPCNFSINIKRGNMVQLPNYVKTLRVKHQEMITAIMKIKYNLLFKYSDEEETVSLFEREKGDFDTTTSLYDAYKTKLIDITNLLSKMETIHLTDLQIFEVVKEIKGMVSDARIDNNPQFLKDAVELYIKKLLDILKLNRESKYSYQSVEYSKDNDEYKLIQKPYTLYDTETVIGDAYKVESLQVKTK